MLPSSRNIPTCLGRHVSPTQCQVQQPSPLTLPYVSQPPMTIPSASQKRRREAEEGESSVSSLPVPKQQRVEWPAPDQQISFPSLEKTPLSQGNGSLPSTPYDALPEAMTQVTGAGESSSSPESDFDHLLAGLLELEKFPGDDHLNSPSGFVGAVEVETGDKLGVDPLGSSWNHIHTGNDFRTNHVLGDGNSITDNQYFGGNSLTNAGAVDPGPSQALQTAPLPSTHLQQEQPQPQLQEVAPILYYSAYPMPQPVQFQQQQEQAQPPHRRKRRLSPHHHNEVLDSVIRAVYGYAIQEWVPHVQQPPCVMPPHYAMQPQFVMPPQAQENHSAEHSFADPLCLEMENFLTCDNQWDNSSWIQPLSEENSGLEGGQGQS